MGIPGCNLAGVRDERGGLERRIDELEHETRQLRDELAERVVASPPAWARDLLGERPEQYQRADTWDRAVREVARYRIEHQIADDTSGLGSEPAAGDKRRDWQRAQRVLEQTQRRLGNSRDRDRGLDREP